MCLAQGPQPSDASEARTRDLSVSSQALYHWATALPKSHQSFGSLNMTYYIQICVKTMCVMKELHWI